MIKEHQKIKLITRALGIFKDVDSDATITTLLIFLSVYQAGQQGLPVVDLTSNTGVTRATISRQLAVLSNIGRGGKKGLSLLTIQEDSVDRRYKTIYITKRGADLGSRMLSYPMNASINKANHA